MIKICNVLSDAKVLNNAVRYYIQVWNLTFGHYNSAKTTCTDNKSKFD